MDDVVKSLKKNGWNLSSDRIKEAIGREEDAQDAERRFLREPEKWLLDQDIKDVGLPSLPEKLNSGGVSQISTPMVLQIKSMQLISEPKSRVDSGSTPRMLKITFTDGKSTCCGIENQHIPQISLKTPPGTKIRLVNTARLSSGFLLLEPKNFQVLGGEVHELVEEWKIQQLLIGHVRGTGQDGGPPPWVPFGHKIQSIEEKKDAKSLEEEKVVKDEEFLNQRQEAISAAGSGVNKIIKGSGRQMEVQMPEKRGRGRGRRERDFSSRDEERALTRPRDTVKLFEFLQPQIGKEEEEEKEEEGEEEADWERDGIYRPPAERSHRGRDDDGGSYRGRGGPRGRRRGFNDDDGDRSYRGGSRGRRGGYRDEEDGRSYRGRGRRSDSGRGGRGRSSYRGSSYYEDSQRRAPSIENLVEDFTSWPGLGPSDPEVDTKRPSTTSSVVKINPGPKAESWAVDDYCLAKWETTEQYYPAVIQQLIPNRKSATVTFVESGAVRIIETKHLRRDPQDVPQAPTIHRGQSTGRIYTPRHRGRVRF